MYKTIQSVVFASSLLFGGCSTLLPPQESNQQQQEIEDRGCTFGNYESTTTRPVYGENADLFSPYYSVPVKSNDYNPDLDVMDEKLEDAVNCLFSEHEDLIWRDVLAEEYPRDWRNYMPSDPHEWATTALNVIVTGEDTFECETVDGPALCRGQTDYQIINLTESVKASAHEWMHVFTLSPRHDTYESVTCGDAVDSRYNH